MTSQYDTIIAGAGNAALTGAIAAREQGARVLVLEKAPEYFRGGNTYFTGGIIRCAYEGIEDIKALVPDVNPSALAIFDNLPRGVHCLVIAFSDTYNGHDYGQAIAVIRSEHPPLLRRSCIHEEVAQGLGLGNDSPQARPSIFNDDDEFALLTSMDEKLLQILYDPRLKPGMDADTVRPIVQELATRLTAPPGSS